MTVKEFLQRIKEGPNKPQTATFMMDLLTILDQFDTEACSTFAGKIRAQMVEAKEAAKSEIPVMVKVKVTCGNCNTEEEYEARGVAVIVIDPTDKEEPGALFFGHHIDAGEVFHAAMRWFIKDRMGIDIDGPNVAIPEPGTSPEAQEQFLSFLRRIGFDIEKR